MPIILSLLSLRSILSAQDMGHIQDEPVCQLANVIGHGACDDKNTVHGLPCNVFHLLPKNIGLLT